MAEIPTPSGRGLMNWLRDTLGRNKDCPCGSGRKLKRCCPTLDWPRVFAAGPDTLVRHLSLRGKNRLFLGFLSDILEVGPADRDWSKVKERLTIDKVRAIHEAVIHVLPDQADLRRVLEAERNHVSAFYVGDYDPACVMRGVTRHCLYSDRILLADPFMYSPRIRPEYDPLHHPEQYGTSTLAWSYLWFRMSPWIDSGVVAFARLPTDFDGALFLECMQMQIAKRSDAEIKAAIDANESMMETGSMASMREYFILAMPDEQILESARRRPGFTNDDGELLLGHIRARRKRHPFFIEPLGMKSVGPGGQVSEMLHVSSGAGYEMAKLFAIQSGSYLVTDIASRWKEIELDHATARIDKDHWSPFAKAFHAAKLSYLDEVPLSKALSLRQEGRLNSMRMFLRRVWKSAQSEQPFSDLNSIELAAELDNEVHQAEKEWKGIRLDLIKVLGSDLAVGVPAIGFANPLLVGAAGVVAAATQIGTAGFKLAHLRASPAGFFLQHSRSSGGRT